MVWQYLLQVWDSITSVGDYTIEWFQNVGNAIAGAIGGMFDFLLHNVSDFFVFLGWFFSNVGGIFTATIQPVQYVFNFLKSFLNNAFSTPVDNAIWSFPAQITEVFDVIPYWNTISAVLGVCLLIF